MKRSLVRLAALPIAALVTVGLTACGASNETTSDTSPTAGGDTSAAAPAEDVSGSIAGAGASSQAAAMEAWKAVFEGAHSGATVAYDPAGSSAGRKAFIGGEVQFAGSDAYLKDDELTAAQARCEGGEVIELPAYISPISVAYSLSGVDKLQLAPATIAKIMDQKIKTWDDPAIAADNPGVTLPSTAITPVNRSDGSGTTKNFTDYLSKAAASDWTYGGVDDWPVQGGTAAKGTSGVVDAIAATDGAIGYADHSQIRDLKSVHVKVGDAFVEPTAEAAAKVVDASPRVEGRGEFDFATDIKRDITEAGAYPVVLTAYTIACTKYKDASEAALTKAFLGFVISKEGQEAAQKNAGSAPISDAFRAEAEKAVAAIN